MAGAVEGIVGFVERRGDRAAEVVWDAALVMVERAAVEARQGRHGRWRSHPKGELRRLRNDLAEALELARLAVHLQEEDELQTRELDLDLAAAAAAVGAARRRAQTLPAERARLSKAAERRSKNFHLAADYPAAGRGRDADGVSLEP